MNVFWIIMDVTETLLVAILLAAIHAIVMKGLLAMVKIVTFLILVRPITATIMQNVFRNLQLNSNVNARRDSGGTASLAMIAMNVSSMKTIDAMHWRHVKILSVLSIAIAKMVSKVTALSVLTLMNAQLVSTIALWIVLFVSIHLVHINANVKLVSRVMVKYVST